MSINYKKENSKYEEIVKGYKRDTLEIKFKTEKNLQSPSDESDSMIQFCTVEKDNIADLDSATRLEGKEYYFVNFKNTCIGKSRVIKEKDLYIISGTFWYVNFSDCIFENIKFINCRFWGCKFRRCQTIGLKTIFENCSFKTVYFDTDENGEFKTKIVSTEFFKCNLTNVKFRNCLLDNSIWDSCVLMLTSFNDCRVNESVFKKCEFLSTVFNNSYISGTGIIDMLNAELEFYGQYKDGEFNKSTYIDLMNYKNRRDSDKKYKEVAQDLAIMYYTLMNCLKIKNSDLDYLEEYRYQYQKNRMIGKENFYSQIWDRISWIICGFGQKLGRFVFWFNFSIIFFAICYMFSGLQLPDPSININYSIFMERPLNLGKIARDFGVCIHFSVVTFSTVGYGNITPLNGVTTFLCTVQILVGILFVAIFTSIVIKKLIR